MLHNSLLFCVTTVISIMTVKYYQWNNRLPGYDQLQLRNKGGVDSNDPDKAAFSMAPHDEEAYAPVNMDDHDESDPHRSGRSDYSDPYGAPSTLASGPYGGGSVASRDISTSYSGAQENPFRQDNPFDTDTEYHRPTPSPVPSSGYRPPTAQDDYEDDHQPAHFPTGNYDRIAR